MMDHVTPELLAALSRFQGQVSGVGKDRKNPHLGNKYATLESVIDTIKEPLAANGLCVSQPCIVDGETAGCLTVVGHVGGGYLTSTMMMPIGDQRGINRAQAIGIVLAYSRRYSLMGILNLATADEDEDGGAPPQRRTESRPEPRPAPAPTRGAAPKPIEAPAQSVAPPATADVQRWTDAERKAWCADLTKAGMTYTVVAALCEQRGRPRPSGMTAAHRLGLRGWLDTPEGRGAYTDAAAAAGGGS